MLSSEIRFKYKNTDMLNINTEHKNPGVSILMSDKLDFKTRTL